MKKTEWELLIYKADDPSTVRRLSAATVNYGSMQIPDALVHVPVGKPIAHANRKSDSTLPADWFDSLTLLRVAVRRKIYSVRTKKSVTEEKVIFEGYANKPSIMVGTAAGEISIVLQHWIRDLANSSMLHEYAHPGHPDDPAFPPLYPTESDTGEISGFSSISSQLGLPETWEVDVPLDFWGNGYKPLLTSLATKEIFGQFVDELNCGTQLNQVSPLAAKALEKIEGPSALLPKPYKEGTPLPLRPGEAGEAISPITEAIVSLIGYQPLQSFSGHTFWDHMVHILSSLFLEIVIRPTDAFIVPLIPTPDQFFKNEVLEGELQHVNWAETTQLATRGIMVLAPSLDNTGAAALNTFTPGGLVPAGCYTETDDPRYGRIQPDAAPDWLNRLTLYSDSEGNTPIRRRETPDNEEAADKPAEPAKINIQTIFDDYARTRYYEEALRYRRAVVKTAYRLDIAPGSTIAVSVRTDAIAETVGSKTTTIIGRVMASSHQLSRQASSASSVFQLGYVTTLEEFQDKKFVSADHPLFDAVFYGAELA